MLIQSALERADPCVSEGSATNSRSPAHRTAIHAGVCVETPRMGPAMNLISGRTVRYARGAAAPLVLVARTRVMGGFGSDRWDVPMVAPLRPQEIALTFDHGPHADFTPRLVDMLAVLGVSATFFLYGSEAQNEPYLTRYIVDCGHIVGCHTWVPKPTRAHSIHHLRENLYRTRNTIEQLTGKSVRLFRPPRGALRPAVVAAARAENMATMLWNVRTTDWRTGSPQRVYRQLVAGIDTARAHSRAANVALQHGGLPVSLDREPFSMEAIRRVVERYRGVRQFVTLDRWFNA